MNVELVDYFICFHVAKELKAQLISDRSILLNLKYQLIALGDVFVIRNVLLFSLLAQSEGDLVSSGQMF